MQLHIETSVSQTLYWIKWNIKNILYRSNNIMLKTIEANLQFFSEIMVRKKCGALFYILIWIEVIKVCLFCKDLSNCKCMIFIFKNMILKILTVFCLAPTDASHFLNPWRRQSWDSKSLQWVECQGARALSKARNTSKVDKGE